MYKRRLEKLSSTGDNDRQKLISKIGVNDAVRTLVKYSDTQKYTSRDDATIRKLLVDRLNQLVDTQKGSRQTKSIAAIHEKIGAIAPESIANMNSTIKETMPPSDLIQDNSSGEDFSDDIESSASQSRSASVSSDAPSIIEPQPEQSESSIPQTTMEKYAQHAQTLKAIHEIYVEHYESEIDHLLILAEQALFEHDPNQFMVSDDITEKEIISRLNKLNIEKSGADALDMDEESSRLDKTITKVEGLLELRAQYAEKAQHHQQEIIGHEFSLDAAEELIDLREQREANRSMFNQKNLNKIDTKSEDAFNPIRTEFSAFVSALNEDPAINVRLAIQRDDIQYITDRLSKNPSDPQRDIFQAGLNSHEEQIEATADSRLEKQHENAASDMERRLPSWMKVDPPEPKQEQEQEAEQSRTFTMGGARGASKG